MLAETERNREMCNQIVRRVFPDPTKTNELPHPVGPLVSNTLFSVPWLNLKKIAYSEIRFEIWEDLGAVLFLCCVLNKDTLPDTDYFIHFTQMPKCYRPLGRL